jgi:hypothetical protein
MYIFTYSGVKSKNKGKTGEKSNEVSNFERNRMMFESKPQQKLITTKLTPSKIPHTVKKWTPSSSSGVSEHVILKSSPLSSLDSGITVPITAAKNEIEILNSINSIDKSTPLQETIKPLTPLDTKIPKSIRRSLSPDTKIPMMSKNTLKNTEMKSILSNEKQEELITPKNTETESKPLNPVLLGIQFNDCNEFDKNNDEDGSPYRKGSTPTDIRSVDDGNSIFDEITTINRFNNAVNHSGNLMTLHDEVDVDIDIMIAKDGSPYRKGSTPTDIRSVDDGNTTFDGYIYLYVYLCIFVHEYL